MKSSVYYIIFLLLFLFSCGKEEIVKPTEIINVINPLPVVTTTAASNVFANSAVGGGNITSDGGYSVTARGVCWSTNQNPTTSDSKTSNGTGIGSFTSNITNLSQSTTYYIRAFATNYKGTGYGNVISITTTSAIPAVTTNSITSIQPTSATCGGNISADYGYPITARGVCWSTSQNPTTSDSKTSNGTGTGSFSSNITGLTAGSTYYVRAYATNSIGTGYGAQTLFSAGNAQIPSLTTTSVSSITTSTAVSGGAISSNGGATITVSGVCWSTSQNPTTANSKTTNGTTSGSYTSSLTGLTLGTTYYVRAYATNSIGTGYGNQLSFTTWNHPTITTSSVTNITSTAATCGGTITSNGGTTITVSGICWSTSQNPTTSNNKTTNGTSSGTFTSNLTGLTLGTTYYVKAYATNSVGTAYGNQVSFIATLGIGESYLGGKVAYIYQTGDPGYIAGQTHGLIVAPSDQSSSAIWGCFATLISGADGTAIGTGAQNTIDIDNGCTTSGIAADLCASLSLNGYSDWFLPSQNEITKLYLNRNAIGGFASNVYWSSTEISNAYAFGYSFYDGTNGSVNRTYSEHVRAVRYF